jgi:hypothetical protein
VAVRSFEDPEGREWVVWEVVPSRRSDLFLPATMAEGWLCFEAAHEKRRLHPIHQTWEGMDAADLWELCRSAHAVKPRARASAVNQPHPEPELT